jgi:hypothetical protein
VPVILDQLVLERVRAEYLEMPGMKLTADQVQRFCGVESAACKPILDALVQTGFLSLRHDGTYVRQTDGELSLPRSRKAPLKVWHVPTTSRRAS